jgi:hypothetical protein
VGEVSAKAHVSVNVQVMKMTRRFINGNSSNGARELLACSQVNRGQMER